jgi:chromosome segregation ATPase
MHDFAWGIYRGILIVAVADSDPNERFGRHRFRGLDPKSVERWAINIENENTGLRGQVAALETRVMEAGAFAEEAVKEMIALQEIVKQTEAQQEMFATRQRLFRDEAAQIVHDAWAEASVVRAQTQQMRDRTQAQLDAARATHTHHLDAMRGKVREEIEATIDQVRAALAAECEEHQSRIAAERVEHQSHIAALESERRRIIAEIEACTTSLLDRIAPLKQATPVGRGTGGRRRRGDHTARA